MENLFFHLPKTRSESPPKVGFWRSGKKALYYLRNSKTMFALISPTENNACKQKYKDNCFQIIDLSFRYPLGILLTQKKDLFITTHTHTQAHPMAIGQHGFLFDHHDRSMWSMHNDHVQRLKWRSVTVVHFSAKFETLCMWGYNMPLSLAQLTLMPTSFLSLLQKIEAIISSSVLRTTYLFLTKSSRSLGLAIPV